MTVGSLVIILGLLQADANGVSQACCGEIRGTVVDASDQPVERVQVQVVEPSGKTLMSVPTATDGTYELRDLPANRYRLKMVARGFYSTEIRDVVVKGSGVTVLSAVAVQVSMIEEICGNPRPAYFRPIAGATGEGAVGGVVVDRKGRPIEGATVTLNVKDMGRVADQRTSNDGAFSIGGIDIRPGEYWLSITHEGHFLEEVEQLEFRPGLEAVYDPIAMEACSAGRCRPNLKALRVCAGP